MHENFRTKRIVRMDVSGRRYGQLYNGETGLFPLVFLIYEFSLYIHLHCISSRLADKGRSYRSDV